MESVPTDELRFDAALMLSQVDRVFDFPALDREFARARRVADRDHDHPHRFFWFPEQDVPAEVTSGWALPSSSDARAKPNAVISEALHCKKNGVRPETLAHLCGPFRDEGGYYTTHALWAVSLVVDAGCRPRSELDGCIRSMQKELIEAQPAELRPERSLDTDLYGERVLTLLLSGNRDEVVADFVRTLVDAQGEDGSFAVAGAEEPAYHGYHATGIAAWALAAWYQLGGEER